MSELIDGNSQKKENLLNLSLDATEAERAKSPALQTGYNRNTKRWELIVKYNGIVETLREQLAGTEIYPLSGGYAIVRLSESQVDDLAGIPQVEYIEKPKRLYFEVNQAIRDACIAPVQSGSQTFQSVYGESEINQENGGRNWETESVTSDLNKEENGKDGVETAQRDKFINRKMVSGLNGRGTLVAIIDSGIDYFHPDFRNTDGTTRITALWDQEQNWIYTREEINRALETGSRERAYEMVRSRDVSGHGTAVAAIAAGNGRESGGRYRGVAWESELLVVKLGTPLADSFPRTTELMRALDYAVGSAQAWQMPVAVNLSFGNTYGSHDGTSLLETYLNSMAERGRTSIIVGTGNEGYGMGHRAGVLQPERAVEIELAVGEYQTGFGVQLWKLYQDRFSVEIVSPGGSSAGVIREVLGTQRLSYETEELLLYYGMPSPYSQAQEIYLDLIPRGTYIQDGIWKIRLIPEEIRDGQYDLWLPAGVALNRETRFLAAAPETTLTIPSTASRAISVGAYDDATQAYADFSGRGFTRLGHQIKPELAAPGVNIITARAGGGYEAVTGTSFAAPFVTGSAALMMQWGIVDGNDPYLYGEKLKAHLIRGARRLPGEAEYPNERVGYGALCLEQSFQP